MKRELTNDEMQQIQIQSIRLYNREIDWTQFILWFYEGICEVPKTAESIDPTAFEIPSEQWIEISGWLNRTLNVYNEKGLITGEWNPAFAWMNSGPSSYDPKVKV